MRQKNLHVAVQLTGPFHQTSHLHLSQLQDDGVQNECEKTVFDFNSWFMIQKYKSSAWGLISLLRILEALWKDVREFLSREKCARPFVRGNVFMDDIQQSVRAVVSVGAEGVKRTCPRAVQNFQQRGCSLCCEPQLKIKPWLGEPAPPLG